MQAATGESQRKVVLVVEDEPIQRLMASRLVERMGSEALVASNAEEAIAILEQRPDVAVVFTDINLATGWDGIRLANYIRGRWPPIAFVITSGHAQPDEAELPAGSTFFAKPYSTGQVTDALNRLLA